MTESSSKSLSGSFDTVTSGGDHKRIFRGFFTVLLFVLLGKSIAALKEIFVAYRFGTSQAVDSYLYVLTLVQFPIGVISGVMASVLIPLIVRARWSREGEVRVFNGECLGIFSLVGIALGVLVSFSLPILISGTRSGLTGEAQFFALAIALPLAVIVPISILARLMAAWTMAGNRHINTLLESLPALGIIVALGISYSPMALVFGTVIGATTELIVIGLGLWLSGELVRPRLSMRSRFWGNVGKAFSVMLIGQFLISLVDLIDQFIAADLGAGSIACLGYTNRIVGLILSLAATAIGRAILPVLSETHFRSPDSVYRISRAWGLGLFVTGALAAMIISHFSESIVRALFQRGEFGPTDTARVAELLGWALFKIPGYLASMVFTYALLSQAKTAIVALLGGVSFVVKVALVALLVPAMGLNGLALSTAGVYFASALFAMLFLARRGSLQ